MEFSFNDFMIAVAVVVSPFAMQRHGYHSLVIAILCKPEFF
jgi:hypothetical protein